MINENEGWNEHAKLVLAELIRLDKNDSNLEKHIKEIHDKLLDLINNEKLDSVKRETEIKIIISNLENKLIRFKSEEDGRRKEGDKTARTISFVISTIIALASVLVNLFI